MLLSPARHSQCMRCIRSDTCGEASPCTTGCDHLEHVPASRCAVEGATLWHNGPASTCNAVPEQADSRGRATGAWPRSAPAAAGAHGQRRYSASPPMPNPGFGRALGPGGRVGGASLTPEKRPAAAKIVQPKGRKGAAARGAAIVPQA